MKRLVHGLVALLVLAGGAGRASADFYTITDLGRLSRSGSLLRLNDFGQIVGNDGSSAFLYSEGQTTKIEPFGTLIGHTARDINNAGQVVGNHVVGPNGQRHAFLYQEGQATDLGTLGGASSFANSINGVGQVVGVSRNSRSHPHAFLYSGGKMIDLGTLPGGGESTAHDINERGQVVGSATDRRGVRHVFLYDKGRMTDLGHGSAVAINNSGQVLVNRRSESNTPVGIRASGQAFLYSEGKMIDLGTLGKNYAQANDINDAGQVVGYIFTKTGDFAEQAFLFEHGKMTDLNSLIKADSGWALLSATAINEMGQIAGFGTGPDGRTRGFLLTPIEAPEPASFALLATGGLSLAGYAWRRRYRKGIVAADS